MIINVNTQHHIAFAWMKDDKDLSHYMASLGHNELILLTAIQVTFAIICHKNQGVSIKSHYSFYNN